MPPYKASRHAFRRNCNDQTTSYTFGDQGRQLRNKQASEPPRMSLQASLPCLACFYAACYVNLRVTSFGSSSPMPSCLGRGADTTAPTAARVGGPLPHVDAPNCTLPTNLQYPYGYTPHLEDFFSPFFQGGGAAGPVRPPRFRRAAPPCEPPFVPCLHVRLMAASPTHQICRLALWRHGNWA